MQKKRFEELEGLRGLAAVVVVIYHFLLAFYLFAYFGPSASGTVQHVRFEDNFYGNPLAALLSGTFAVAIFFVLSGFVLSIGFFQSGGNAHGIKKLASKRYLRLMIPALVSTMICFLIITLGVSKIPEAGAITQSSWLAGSWQFSPTFFDALGSGLYGIFVEQGSLFNNVLWTMKIEFMGSFIVFGFLLLFGKMKYRWVAYVVLLLGTFNTWYFAFAAGVLVADMYAAGRLAVKKRSLWVIIPVLVASIYLGGYPVLMGDTTYFYGFFSSINDALNWKIILITLGAIGLFLLVLLSSQLAKLFSRRILSGLGKYTFSLYLVHIPVIYTIGVASFLFFHNGLALTYNLSVIAAFVACMPVVAGATLLFERYVDRPAIALSSRAAKVFMGEEKLSWNRALLSGKWASFKERIGVTVKGFTRRSAEEMEE